MQFHHFKLGLRKRPLFIGETSWIEVEGLVRTITSDKIEKFDFCQEKDGFQESPKVNGFGPENRNDGQELGAMFFHGKQKRTIRFTVHLQTEHVDGFGQGTPV